MTDRAMAALAQCGLSRSLTALFIEEQCRYPGPDDTRWLDLKSASERRYAPVVGVSEGCESKPTICV